MKLLINQWDCELEDVNNALQSGVVKVEGCFRDSERMLIYCKNGKVVEFFHDQECCESVWIEDGEMLLNGIDIFTDCEWCKLEIAEQSDEYEDCKPIPKHDDSFTWTFYKFTTNKGYDTIRWYGTSNGCYSESVDMRIWGQEE